MDYLPITVQMKGRRCLIVGGGEVASRKLKHLLKAQSEIVLVSPEFSEEVKEIALQNTITLIQAEFSPELLDDFYLVIAATDKRLVNRQVSIAAQQLNIWVNVVDDLELSTFIMPAVIDRSPLLIAVSSSGVSPVLARKIREKIEWLLPKSLGNLLKRLKDLRPKIKSKFTDLVSKRQFSEWYIETALADENRLIEPEDKVIEQFELSECFNSAKGKVYLVGAGPGDVELLTVKALKIIQKADIVLHDALVSAEILACVRKDASLVHVGKRANRHFVSQQRTNELMVEYASKGLTVVRLKGGDPFIFGRGGEELQFLNQHRVDFEVVPGITAAAGCAAYSGIPLTHRDYSQSLRFITGHEKQGQSSLDWNALAVDNQTLVFYMGLMKNQLIRDELIQHGLSYQTPVAVIEKGTTPEQRVVVGQLHQLPELVDNNQIQAPALIVVGQVVQLAEQLQWYQHGELVIETPSLAQVANA